MKTLKYHILNSLFAVLLCFGMFSTTVFAGGEPEQLTEEYTEVITDISPGEPLSEETDIVTRDLLYDKATNKQFVTIQDRAGNVFYLVIDYDAPVNEDEEQYKTYFLNQVDTADLAALAEEGDETVPACICTERCKPGQVNMNCEVCANDMASCMGTDSIPEPELTPEPEEEEPERNDTSNNSIGKPFIFLILFVLLGGGGAVVYIKLFKNKSKTRGNTDLDDYDYGEDEADVDGEDDMPWESEEESDTEVEDAENSEETEDEPS